MQIKTGLRRQLATLAATALTLSAALASPAAQAEYPEHPINMVVSYGPGGGTDLIARALAPFIEKYLGKGAQIVVLNRPGAGGAIGFAEVARAKPDGYTIGFLNTPNLITIPIERKAQYRWTDFDLIGNLIDDPDSFAVNTSSNIKNLADLAAYAKANPGKVTVGTTGIGSDDHLAMLLFEKSTGTKMTHVPYKGAGEVRSAISSGEIFMAAMNIGEAMAYIKAGSPMRDLGVMSQERSPIAPDLATFKEQGHDITMSSLRGIGAPKGLPPEVKAKLVQAVQKAVQDPAFRAKAEAMYAPLRYLAPKEYEAELRANEALFQNFWKETPWAER
ncbi:tripartite tricarboxylate transporter substrate binding protein [Bordetella petrii]|uniref:tripartite tricarboxylate transporter substrate binding protein n=1 Tax=Bordetella petrii TaxID=94624 RepID=UPI001A96049A|nr:tripartite tricarboxylate transporter substrate binding protein [Bordetella petrii]MBO1112415.1 tripartite tricarboxylate transporter substrate binding protein [Bordetella petrii]